MQSNRQLYWGQGQFLTPQHLQQQDAHARWQAQYFWKLAAPHGRGVVSLAVREEGLAARIFEISRCEVITAEGVLLRGGADCEDANANIAPASFAPFFDGTTEPLGVYLALPRTLPGRTNLQSDGGLLADGALPPRFDLVLEEREDLFEATTLAAQVGFVRFNVPIIFQREARLATAMQVAELVKIAEIVPETVGMGGRVSIHYIPPSLKLSSSPVLLNKVKAVRDQVTSKALEYEGIKRNRQDPLRLMQMQTLNRYVPLLHHLLERADTHPESAYALIRRMVGELSVFSQSVTVLGAPVSDVELGLVALPPYDHDDLYGCFEVAIARLLELVRGLDAGVEAGIPLIREGRYWKAFLPPSLFETERGRYYLAFDSAIRGEALWTRLQKTAKVSPMEDMPRLLASALFGLKLELVPIPPEDLPQRAGSKTFFEIDVQDVVWSRVKAQQNIAVHCDLDPVQTGIKLFFVPES